MTSPKPTPTTNSTNRRRRFAEKTTFHGFRELYDSTNTCQRVFWILIILLCIALLLVFIAVQLHQYVQGQTGTRVTRLDDGDEIAPIIIVVLPGWSWIDAEKVRAFGISPEEMLVAMGYGKHGVTYQSDTVSIDEAKVRLKTTMHRLNVSNALEFYALIALESIDASPGGRFGEEYYRLVGRSSDQLTDRSSIQHPSINISEVVFADSDMYTVIDTPPVYRAPFTEGWQFGFRFNFTTFDQNRLELSQLLPVIDQYPNTPFLFNIDNYMKVGMRKGFSNHINTESTIYRKLGTCMDRPMKDLYFMRPCKLDCEIRVNQSLHPSGFCLPYISEFTFRVELTPQFRSRQIDLCHLGLLNPTTGEIEGQEHPRFNSNLTPDQIKRGDRELTECQKECTPKCDQWATSWSVGSFDTLPAYKDTADTLVVYPSREKLIVIEEFTQYEWYDFVSDLGGLLGLWLGASMMSLFQLVHLCCLTSHGDED